MEILGLELARADLEAWLGAVRDFALPRLFQSLGILGLAAVLYWSVRWSLRRLARSLERTRTELDNFLVAAVRRLALISIAFWALWRLAHIWEMAATGRFVAALWIVALALPVGTLAGDLLRVMEERVTRKGELPLDQTSLPLLNKVVRFLVVAAGVLVALEYLGINITPLLAGAGVVGLALSLAAKDTLSNLIAGVLLILDRPFQVGDRIELWNAPEETGTWGDVVEIGLRATKIRNPDNLVIVIPNNEIMRRDIVNYTASGTHIRLRVPIGIAYDADVELAKKLILEIAGDVSGVKDFPEPVAIVRNFGDSAVKLELRIWIDDARDRRAIGDEITGRVKAAFDEHGVEIPYPKRDLYLRGLPAAAISSGFLPEARREEKPGTSFSDDLGASPDGETPAGRDS